MHRRPFILVNLRRNGVRPFTLRCGAHDGSFCDTQLFERPHRRIQRPQVRLRYDELVDTILWNHVPAATST